MRQRKEIRLSSYANRSPIAGMWAGEDLRFGNKWGISRRDM